MANQNTKQKISERVLKKSRWRQASSLKYWIKCTNQLTIGHSCTPGRCKSLGVTSI